MYRELDVNCIVTTLERLHRRIGERFPESGLSKVSAVNDVESRRDWEMPAEPADRHHPSSAERVRRFAKLGRSRLAILPQFALRA